MDTKRKIDAADDDTKLEQHILANNAWHLARYVIEHDHKIDLPPEFEPGQFMHWAETYPTLEDKAKIKFVDQYAKLEKASKDVTARTLIATRIHGQGFRHAAFHTSVGLYLTTLLGVTIFFFGMLLLEIFTGGIAEKITFIPLLKNVSPNIFTPFFAAGLGTCVYLLRTTQEQTINSRV